MSFFVFAVFAIVGPLVGGYGWLVYSDPRMWNIFRELGEFVYVFVFASYTIGGIQASIIGMVAATTHRSGTYLKILSVLISAIVCTLLACLHFFPVLRERPEMSWAIVATHLGAALFCWLLVRICQLAFAKDR